MKKPPYQKNKERSAKRCMNIEGKVRFTVPDSMGGMRLDAALAWGVPAMGIRARRRLWEWCEVTVNGRKKKAGYCVAAGDSIEISPIQSSVKQQSLPVRLVRSAKGYIFLLKPAGLHTAHIAGSQEPSLEQMLPGLWETWRKKAPLQTKDLSSPLPLHPPILLTRLDQGTSGLVIGACSEALADQFRDWEHTGNITKTYFALVRGKLCTPLRITNALDVANKRKTLVLEYPAEATRHTVVMPLPAPSCLFDSFHGKGGESTFVRIQIKRGARHQIRAHLASCGFPLLGDFLYDETETEGQRRTKKGKTRFYLHHAQIELPSLCVTAFPAWAVPFMQAFSEDEQRTR